MLKQYFLLSLLILFYCVTFCISFQAPTHAQDIRIKSPSNTLTSSNIQPHSGGKKDADSIDHPVAPAEYKIDEAVSSSGLLGLGL